MEMIPLLNLSMNETLARTVATNFAMLLALGSLMLLGPDVIESFTTALLFSVIVGTYSTIYIAAPFLVWLKVTSDSFLPKTTAQSGAERVRTHSEGY
jgi:preprotein translocase subunit SecF